MKRLLCLLLVTMVCLSACGVKEAAPEAEPEEEKLTLEEIVNYMSLTYVNGASTASNYDVETDIVLSERHFVFEDVVSNPAELLVYNYFYAIGTGDYEYLVNHIVGSDMKRKIQSVLDADSNGVFYKSVTLHEMEIVPIEEFFGFNYDFCEEVATLAGAAKLTEYTVVKARSRYEYNDLSLELNPDLKSGEDISYIFVGRTDGDYFLFETYAEEFVKTDVGA